MKPKANQELVPCSDSVIYVPDLEGGIFVTEKEVIIADVSSSQGPELEYNVEVSVSEEELELRVEREDVKPLIAGDKEILKKYIREPGLQGQFEVIGGFTLNGVFMERQIVTEYDPHQPHVEG